MSSRDTYENGFDEDDGKTITGKACPECAGGLLTDGGETRCTDCGLIVDEYRFDHAAKRVTFVDSERNRERTGAPLTPARHDRGLSSEIGRGRDGNGNSLPSEKRREFYRLRRHHDRARWGSRAERNLGHGCGEIARLTGRLELPRSIRDRACTLFREAQDEDLLMGRSIEAMAAGAIYAACRCDGYLRTIDEIVEVAQCTHSEALNAYRVLNAEIGLKSRPPRPQEYVSRFVSECRAPDRVRERARELADVAENAGLANGRNPAGVAAACLYVAARECGVPCTQAELAAVAEVTEVTIRERYYELREEIAEEKKPE